MRAYSKIRQDVNKANRIKGIDPKTKLEDLNEAIRKHVRMKEREINPKGTLERMKRAQEKRIRRKEKLFNSLGIILPTAGRDESSLLNNESSLLKDKNAKTD